MNNQVLVKVSVVPAGKLGEHLEGMNIEMQAWTEQAARGECGWTCSDCCCSDSRGMPDACFHGHQRCTDIIARDKGRAMGYPHE
jgi:hypothetical protein